MSFSVTILGSSSAVPTPKRNLTAHLVNHDERFFLIDCGEGTQLQLRRFSTKYNRINHIFISHLHGDHVFGLFGLISSLSLAGRKNTLHIYSNHLLKEILETHLNFFNTEMLFEIEYHFFNNKESELIYEDNKLTVTTIPLKHRIPCVGFLFKENNKEKNIRKELIATHNMSIKDIISVKEGNDFTTSDGRLIANKDMVLDEKHLKSYAFCTDTLIRMSIAPIVKDVDLLYHEATFLDVDSRNAKNTYHSTALQAATLAKEANVKKLLLGHFSTRYDSQDEFAIEAKKVFENTFIANDGMTIEI